MKEYIRSLNDVSRRDFAAYLARTCLGVGVLPLLGGPARAFAQSSPSSGRTGKSASKLIYLYMSGGMTHLDTFDPKPGTDQQGPVEVIKTNADGVRLTEFMPKLAGQADKLAIINSMRTTTGAHEQGRYYMRTSYAMRGSIRHPSIGSWMMRMNDTAKGVLPGYVMIGGGSGEANAGWMDSKYAPVPLGGAGGGLPHGRMTVKPDEFEMRLAIANEFDKPFRRKYTNVKSIDAYTDLYKEAIQLMNSKDLDVFDINKESESVREAYGNNGFGQGMLLARRLVEQNVNCVEVHLGGWDTHTDNFNAVEGLAGTLDQGLAALLEDLGTRGLLKDTVVALGTEFGRTPDINVNRGRDHHPTAFSCLLAGGPIKGGMTYGKSDSQGRGVEENAVTIPDFNATIGAALGMPITEVFKSSSGRPFTFADKGQPIQALLS